MSKKAVQAKALGELHSHALIIALRQAEVNRFFSALTGSRVSPGGAGLPQQPKTLDEPRKPCYDNGTEEDHELLSDVIRVVYVELNKLRGILKKPVGEMTDLEKWAVFFRYANVPKYREVVNEIIDSKEALTVAGELLMGVSQDEHERAVFRSRRMAETDRMSDLATARDCGRRDRDREIVLHMLSLGIPVSGIRNMTGLTEDEIQELVKQQQQ